MREQILKLRASGKRYHEIAAILGCNYTTVANHCNPVTREKMLVRRRAATAIRNVELKQDHGGKCVVCKYDRCLRSLQFHHVAPEDKAFSVSSEGWSYGKARVAKEAEKCLLVCANCHGEIHEGIILVLVDGNPIQVAEADIGQASR